MTQVIPGAPVLDLSGLVMVVTGASSGIGARAVTTLAAAGATVFAAARRLEKLEVLAEAIGLVRPVRCDVTVEGDRQRLIEAAQEQSGHIDVLVNNAGVAGGLVAEAESADDFRRVIETNLVAPFDLARRCAAVAPSSGASIINVASIVGVVSTAPVGGAGYAASKAGLIGMTRELAGQWGHRGIRVNALVPGWFASEMTDDMFDDDRSRRWIERNTMLNRPGATDELDGALTFLASSASSYVTGQTLIVDGGWTAR